METLNNMLASSISVIAGVLGRTFTYVEMFRNEKNNTTEVWVTVGYNVKKAIAEAKKALKNELIHKSAKLAEELDRYLPE